jgi:hypothetical protein
MTVRALLVAVLALTLASSAAHAEIHKCRQGDRVIYQEHPCPSGSLSLPPPEALPPPSAFAVEEARARAKNDLAAAETLRKREEKAARAREKSRSEARIRETDCTRLLDKIEKTEAKAAVSKRQKNILKSDQRKYRKECGPL